MRLKRQEVLPEFKAMWRAQTRERLLSNERNNNDCPKKYIETEANVDPAFTATLARYSEGLNLGSPQAQSVHGVSRTGTTGSLEAWDQKRLGDVSNP